MADKDPFAGLPADFIPAADARKGMEDLGKFARTFSGLFALAKLADNVEGLAAHVRELEGSKKALNAEIKDGTATLVEIKAKLVAAKKSVAEAETASKNIIADAKAQADDRIAGANATIEASIAAGKQAATEAAAAIEAEANAYAAQAKAEAAADKAKAADARTELFDTNEAVKAAKAELARINAEIEAALDRLRPR